MPQRKKTIQDIESEIRDLINDTILYAKVRKDKLLFNQLCSTLDTIGDTELAIKAYKQTENFSSPNLYLVTYGILQVLFVQQDAIQHLAEALSVPLDIYKSRTLISIRNIRAKSVGHPTKKSKVRGKKKETHPHNFISRPTLRLGGFQLLSFAPRKKTQITDVDISGFLTAQGKEISRMLRTILRVLKRRIKIEQDKYKRLSLTRHFANIGYDLEKLSEDIGGYSQIHLGDVALKLILSKVAAFRKDIRHRAIDEGDVIEESARKIRHSVQRLKDYLNRSSIPIEKEDAIIFCDSIRHEINTLEKCATEIDEEYNPELKVKSRLRAPRIKLGDLSDLLNTIGENDPN